MNNYKELTTYLQNYASEARQVRIEEILALRTRHLTVVMENLINSHNVSAVARSAEALGLQELHSIEDNTPLQNNSQVMKGAGKWLELNRYQSTTQCSRVIL